MSYQDNLYASHLNEILSEFSPELLDLYRHSSILHSVVNMCAREGLTCQQCLDRLAVFLLGERDRIIEGEVAFLGQSVRGMVKGRTR